jgi:long-chain acyl-CoA synthetase
VGDDVANLAQHLLDTAAQHGDRPALRMDDAVLTYDGFRDAAAAVAAGCGRGACSPATGWRWSCRTC